MFLTPFLTITDAKLSQAQASAMLSSLNLKTSIPPPENNSLIADPKLILAKLQLVTVFMGISVFLSCLLGVFMEGNNIRSIHE